MSGYLDRRRADIRLWRAAKQIRRDRDQPVKVRRVARKISLAFAIRIALCWHTKPRPWLARLTASFRYGRYCGVGHGAGSGEGRDPLDELDAACKVHDDAYNDAEKR